MNLKKPKKNALVTNELFMPTLYQFQIHLFRHIQFTLRLRALGEPRYGPLLSPPVVTQISS